MKSEKMMVAEKVFNIKKQTAVNDCADLFELLKNLVCCSYISDLRAAPYNAKAQMILKVLDLDQFSARQINDVCQYIGATL